MKKFVFDKFLRLSENGYAIGSGPDRWLTWTGDICEGQLLKDRNGTNTIQISPFFGPPKGLSSGLSCCTTFTFTTYHCGRRVESWMFLLAPLWWIPGPVLLLSRSRCHAPALASGPEWPDPPPRPLLPSWKMTTRQRRVWRRC